MRDASMVIGLGGIGCNICAKVEALIPENAPDRDRVRFAALDTDINSLQDLKRNGFRGTTIQISDNISVGLCVENQKQDIDAWYPANPMFDKKPMTEGAGQMRVISRLALHTAVREGRLEPLYRVLQELREVSKEPAAQSIRIYIISSLSGGTGSGIFLPLAMYLERYVKSLFGDFDSIIKGFFILPSAMKELASTALERRSLDSNSYAAIKELNAFLKQEDEKQWADRKLFIELAQEGEAASIPYYSAGYEYCYVFGKVDRRKLLKSSFEEVENAVANAVYMQVCSPIRGANNSREDNTPKFLAEQAQVLRNKKLRRFGAIGCGELVYPYRLLQKYYAMCWAADTMENQWRKYDETYFKKEEERREERRKGKKPDPVNRAEEYVNAIRQADRGDMLAEEIRDVCAREDGMAWDLYLEAVSEKVRRWIGQVQSERVRENGDELIRQLQDIQSKHKKKKDKIRQIRKIREYFAELRKYMKKRVTGNSRLIAEQLSAYFPGMDQQPDELAYWLKQEEAFIHPNGVRYFLYNLLEAVEKKKNELSQDREQDENYIDAVDNYSEERYKRIRRRDIPEFRDTVERARKAVYEAARREMEIRCMEYLKTYVGGLVRSYEEFYDNYKDIVRSLLNEAEDAAFHLDRQTGVSSFYVCADKRCREVILGRLKGKREYMGASSALSAFVFQLLRKPLKKERVKEVCPKIKQHWIDSAEQEFGQMLDMNIVQAMRLEEECHTGYQLETEGMKTLIDDSRRFLETPLVRYISREEMKEISFCCYNSELQQQQGIYGEICKWLEQRQGIADPYYCSRYQLIFYCSVVGIEAHDILDFYHGRENSLIEDGEAFRHYEDTVRSVVLDDGENPVLVPHIDKKWYSFLYLADSHAGYQQREEMVTAAVFLYAVLTRKVVADDRGYRFNQVKICDTHFEKLRHCHQYLYKRPLLLRELLDKFTEELAQDVKNCRRVDDCRLYGSLSENNLFDSMLRYAGELTDREFTAREAEILIRAAWRLLAECICRFCGRNAEAMVWDKLEEISKTGKMREIEENWNQMDESEKVAREMEKRMTDWIRAFLANR